MPRGKAPISPVAGSRKRHEKFEKRKAGLMKKAHELATLCDVPVAVVCSGVDGEGDPEYWPSKEVAEAVADRYRALPEEERKKHTKDHPAYLEGQIADERSKLARVQKGGIADLLGAWDCALDDMPEEALRELLRSIDDSLVAVRSRIRKLQPQHDGEANHDGLVPGLVDVDEVMAGNSMQPQHGGEADHDGIVLGLVDVDEFMSENSLTGDADADGNWLALGLDLLGQLGGNTMPPNAAPLLGLVDVDENMAENSATGDADDDGGWLGLLGGNTMPPNAAPVDVDEVVAENFVTGEDASDRVQGLQPLGDADPDPDDAAWMLELVQDLKEKPEPSNEAQANGSAAPYNAGIEYINLGGYVMERDAYDFIRYDLGMPPPSLEPESPDYGEPLQLWSWDESSFPQSAPPPPPK